MKKIVLFFIFFTVCTFAKEKIVVFHAGSLSAPFAEMEKEFEARYPQYDVVREAAGSRACAHKITDIGKAADVMASAAYQVIDNLLIPSYAKFNVRFATNEMVIAYTTHSRFSNEINASNWPEVLLKKNVRIGHSNPNLDPCGYRSLLVTKLAERYYHVPGFYDKLLGYGESYQPGEEKKGKVIVRPKETDLLGLLEAGAFDYLYIYKSVAQQHGLRYITLPAEINLGSERYRNFYRQVSVKVSGKKPGTWIVKGGAPMIYGITVVENEEKSLPVNPKGAVAFVNFVLSKQGQAIMKKAGQGVVDPPVVTGDASILER